MHLGFITSNIIHQTLEKEANIIYQPSNSLFDRILYDIDYNFFIFDEKYPINDNAVGLPETHIDLYSYDLFIGKNILQHMQQQIPVVCHVNSLIFAHQYKPHNLKKEDLILINNQQKNIKKIFFDENCLKSWNNLNKSLLCNYGIPTNIFFNKNNDRDGSVMIACDDENLSIKIKDVLAANQSDIIQTQIMNIYEPLDTINNQLNNCNILISNNIYNALCGLACGCISILLTRDNIDIPHIIYEHSLHSLVQNMPHIANRKINYDQIYEYITKSCNYHLFKQKISEIIYQTAKREAFIL